MRLGSSSRRLFKIGKKFCFPDAPSSWVSRTVDSIEHYQDHRPKHQILKMGVNVNQNNVKLQYRSLLGPRPGGGPWIRDHSVKDGFTWCIHNQNEVNDFLHEQIDDNENRIPFKKGDPLPFDLMSLLSTNDNGEKGYLVRNDGLKVEVDTLRGKNILVCCFFLPQFWLSDVCDRIRGMINAFSNLPNYEMVMVAKMRRNWVNDEDAFNHFFSAFPSSWLAVPFFDTLRREKICNSLGLFSHPMSLLLDHHQKVVVHQRVYVPSNYDPEFSWWDFHPHLHLILRSEFVFKINNNYATVGIDQENKISVFELKDKLVGLYLCYDGSLIRTLNLVSQECKARDQEFHIILVYIPYGCGSRSVDPLLFQEAINHVLHKLEIPANPNWWVSPFNDFVSRKLYKDGDYRYYSSITEDELVIFDPKMNVMDHLGKYVINRLGINGYPFTRQSIVQRELEVIRAVTLESLLVYGSRDYVLRMNNDIANSIDEVPVGELRGKHVLVYMDQVETPTDTYDTLLEWYNRNKTARVADFEVVFVHFDGESFGSPKPKPMPWLVCPFDPQHTDFVKESILKAGKDKGILAAFDKDGHLITLYAEDLLDSFGPEGFPSYNGLHNEMVHHIEIQHLLDMDDFIDDGPARCTQDTSSILPYMLFT